METRFAGKSRSVLDDTERHGKSKGYRQDIEKTGLSKLDKPPPKGYTRWNGKLLPEALGDVGQGAIDKFIQAYNPKAAVSMVKK